MSTTKDLCRVFVRLALRSTLVLIAGVGYAQVNAVYVESNIGQVANTNSVYGWSNDGAGNLTALPNSPYLTGGTGVFQRQKVAEPVFQADQEVVINPANKTLLTVNGHTNTIAVMKIHADGSLSPIAGSPFPSNGHDPVSLGLDLQSPAGPILTVVNQAEDPLQTGGVPNFTNFKVSPTGTLTPITGATITVPPHSKPAQALVSPNGQFVFGLIFKAGGRLTSWTVTPGAHLRQQSVVTPSGGTAFLGETTNPLFNTIYVGMPDVNDIAIYTYDSTGVLTFANTVSNPGLEVCWLTTNAAATRLYTTETISNSMSVYDISNNTTTPVLLQHLTLDANTGAATNLKLDPTEKFLYVLGSDLPGYGFPGNTLHVLSVNADGTVVENVTPISIPVAAGELPQGLATFQIP